MAENALLSVAVVASTLGVSRQRVHQLIGLGRLRARRWDGLHWVIEARELEEYIGADVIEAGSAAVQVEWRQLRRAILAMGGIGPSPDWPRDWYPGDLYRKRGAAPDVVAAECFITTSGGAGVIPWASSNDGNLPPSDDAMFSYLQRAYADRHVT